VTFTTVELTIFVAAIVLMLALSWVLRSTTLGRRIRAVAQDRVAATLLGVDLERTIAATFFIASSLGGAAGVLTGLEYNSVTLDMGSPIELKGLAIIILGGMGSVTGAVIGGFIIGAVETLAVALGLSEWRDAITFGVMFVILVARPSGLFGKRALRQA
jgi:branched-chain amino acid transport system permease protein